MAPLMETSVMQLVSAGIGDRLSAPLPMSAGKVISPTLSNGLATLPCTAVPHVVSSALQGFRMERSSLTPAFAQSSWLLSPHGMPGGSGLACVPPQVSKSCMDLVESTITCTSIGFWFPPVSLPVAVAVTACAPKPRTCMNQGLTVVCSVTLIPLHLEVHGLFAS